jgi:Domain of unknown function (DUF4149)
MSRFAASLHWICVTAWVGGLWAIGYLVAPALFHHLPDRSLAGTLAGHLFAYFAYAGLACGLYLIVYRLAAAGLGALRQGFFWIVILMLALTLAGQFGVQPLLSALRQQALPRQVMESLFRDRFAMWHGVASIMFLVQSLLGLGLVLLQRRVI